MTQRITEQRATTIGLGLGIGPGVQADFPDEEGEVVNDDELIGPNEAEQPSSMSPSGRFSAPRISQRLPRLSVSGGGALEGEILVGRYRVERVVSRTTHEVVLEASHLELGQRVLLWHLTPLASTSPEAVARFQRGARKAREMRSEHAERVVDFGRLETGSPYRAVELPHGPSLAEILRVRGQLPIAEAVDTVLTACEPVAEAHASGIVHRCLRVTNIFVERRSDGTPLVRVLDFGVSDPLEPDWVHGDDLPVPGATQSVDTLRYAAPEQIRNPSAVDARADVWALGAILYELIAGAPLFQAESSLTLLAMIAADAPTPLGLLRTDVPPELEELVLSCLEKDPEARPRSVVELVLGLSPFASVEAQPAAARVARIVMRTTRPPPLPSHGPASAGRTSALVRSRPPLAPLVTKAAPQRGEARDFGFLFAGAGIGLAAALFAMLFVQKQQPAAVAPISAAVPVATTPVLVTPAPVLPTATTQASLPSAAAPIAPVQRLPAPAAKPVAQAVQEPAAVPRVKAKAERAQPVEDKKAPSPVAQAIAKPKTDATGTRKVTASADDLFGGLD